MSRKTHSLKCWKQIGQIRRSSCTHFFNCISDYADIVFWSHIGIMIYMDMKQLPFYKGQLLGFSWHDTMLIDGDWYLVLNYIGYKEGFPFLMNWASLIWTYIKTYYSWKGKPKVKSISLNNVTRLVLFQLDQVWNKFCWSFQVYIYESKYIW